MDSFQVRDHMYINDQADIKDKVVIITGANRGLGKATAYELAKRGGTIYFACRNEELTLQAIEEIKDSTKNHQLYFLELDLASFKSIQEFSTKFHRLETKLDILINNAGVMTPLKRTTNGFEMNFGVNHLGHFMLTNLLIDLLKASIKSRIVVVASSLHSIGTINKDDINSNVNFPGPYMAYARSKLCNILFMRELSKRLQGTGVTCNAVCPGPVGTDVMRDVSPFERIIFGGLKKIFEHSPETGCQPIVMLAVEPSISEISGKYFERFELKEPLLRGQNYEEWLWQKSEELIESREKKQDGDKNT